MIDDDPLAAYSLNNAVWLFGMSLEAELNRNPKPSKEDRKEEQRRTRILNRWIPKASDADATEKAPEQPKRRQFADPKPTK